jgi:phosphoribosylformylglycinamidine synthase
VIGETRGHLGQSIWLREIAGREDGPPPPVDLDRERETGELIRRLVIEGKVTAVHDVADGGLLVAVAEMALAGNVGARLEGLNDPAQAFGEDQGRYIVTVKDASGRDGIALPVTCLGVTGGDSITGAGREVRLQELRSAHEEFFPRLMGKELHVA